MLPQLDPNTWQIETERLIIRPPQIGDGLTINSGIRDSFEELKIWMPWAKDLPTVQESEAFLRKAHEDFRSGIDFPVHLWLKDGTFVGACGLHPINRVNASYEIGYWCRTLLARQGYISEAVKALIAFAFVNFQAQRLQIRCAHLNVASRKVAEKCGFTFEARLWNYERANDGNLRDVLIFVRCV